MTLAATTPVVREHPIDPQQIDPRALKILRQLDEANAIFQEMRDGKIQGRMVIDMKACGCHH